jgi:zinc transporter ZupT
MKEQGFSIPKILVMWTSIMLVTGILSAVGSVVFADVPKSVISLLESMAAGAMLTVIAETMLPEAYAKGGPIVGLSTLLGLLAVIVIKSLE